MSAHCAPSACCPGRRCAVRACGAGRPQASPHPVPSPSRWYFAVISVSGVFAVTFSVVFAYVADITQEHERSMAYGQVRRPPAAPGPACLVTSQGSACLTGPVPDGRTAHALTYRALHVWLLAFRMYLVTHVRFEITGYCYIIEAPLNIILKLRNSFLGRETEMADLKSGGSCRTPSPRPCYGLPSHSLALAQLAKAETMLV